MTTLIKNARLVNEGKVFEGDLLMEGDRIARIDKELSPVDNRVKVLDVGGKWVLPGMIDTQVHFREPGLTHKGTISSESAAAVLGGITSYVEQPNTVPQAVTLEELEKKYQRASEVSWANYSFNLGATNANLDELKKASKRTIAGIKIFMGSSTGNMLVDDPQALERIFSEVDHQLIAHCEDEGTIRANLDRILAEVGEAGLTPAYHPLIRSEEACWKSSSAAVALARKTGARFHVYHLSTGKELQLFDKHLPLEQKKITAEACIHHLWFTDADYATKQNFIKWNPAIKTEEDRAALRAGLLDGSIDVIATDHAPHTLEEKQATYSKAPSGGPLAQHAVVAVLELVRKGVLPLERAVELMCHRPAILFGVEDRGFLREGYFADLVVVDPSQPWTVSKSNVASLCGWSPFEGSTFAARIVHTFVNGQHVVAQGKLNKEPAGQRLLFRRD
jgi:dihydroorotase